MAKASANVRVISRTDLLVNNQIQQYLPGDHLVPEGIADRIVASGCGVRLKARGKRLPQGDKTGAADGAGE